jgi:hypothetical protein
MNVPGSGLAVLAIDGLLALVYGLAAWGGTDQARRHQCNGEHLL